MAERRGLAADEVIVDLAKLGRLNDRLYILEAAVEDVQGDLAGRPTVDTYREAVVHLLEAALPLRNAHLEPKASGAP